MGDPINCPFCGGAAICDPVPAGPHTYHKVFCRSVLTCGAASSSFPDRAEAIAAWNRRSNIPGIYLSAEPPMHWRCFHCNYVARTRDEGVAHFGLVMNERQPACIDPAVAQGKETP